MVVEITSKLGEELYKYLCFRSNPINYLYLSMYMYVVLYYEINMFKLKLQGYPFFKSHRGAIPCTVCENEISNQHLFSQQMQIWKFYALVKTFKMGCNYTKMFLLDCLAKPLFPNRLRHSKR